MKRIRFLLTEQYESEGRNKGPIFLKGHVFELEDDFADRWLRRLAAERVSDDTPLGAPVDLDPVDIGNDVPESLPLADNTIAQLKEIAAAEQIDISEVTLKADIIAAIELAREEKAQG